MNSNYNAKLLAKLFLIIALCIGCNNSSDDYSLEKQRIFERPKDVWVFRSVLDSKIRMLSIGLNDELWVAYSTETGSLFKAWKGGVELTGTVYGKGGGQPTTQGNTYIEKTSGNPWVIISNGSEIIPEVHYKGYTLFNDQVLLEYELVHDGEQITIEERPEYNNLPGEQIGFKRLFKVSGAPSDIEVGLKLNLGSIISQNNYQTDGKLIINKQELEEVSGEQYQVIAGTLLLNKNNETNFSIAFTPKPATETAEEKVEKEISKENTQDMMESFGCTTCHGQYQKAVGPSYQAVARRYKNTKENLNKLVTKVINGGSGNWGEVAMTPHTEMPEADVRKLVSYILNLDQKEEKELANFSPDTEYPFIYRSSEETVIDPNAEKAGIAVNIFQLNYPLYGFPQIKNDMVPQESGILNMLYAFESDFETDFEGYENNFAIQARGFLNIKEASNIDFRLASNDGSRLYINEEMVVETVGNWTDVEAEGSIYLEAGKHPFTFEYYDRGGDKNFSLQWRRNDAEEYSAVPARVFTFNGSDVKEPKSLSSLDRIPEKRPVPGDGEALDSLHPSFDLAQARPEDFHPKVGGMDFMSDGRLVVSTWDSLGAVYILEGVQGDNPEEINVKRFASGLAEPLGLKVVEDEIYVLQKQELTKLVDINNDGVADEYRNICNSWTTTDNHHEFAFGLVYEDGYFYGTLSLAIEGPGPSAPNQAPARGKVFKISREDGTITYVANGLRTPNGIGRGVDNEIFIADNQGDWLPANKILHLQKGAFYGNRSSLDSEDSANVTETLPIVYLEHDQIGNSPSQPVKLDVGPYQNQMIHGDVTHGGIKRVYAEKVNGSYQGAVFRFTQGLEAGVNRMKWGANGALYIGGIGNGGNWGQYGKLRYGLQKLTFNGETTFEMLAVRARSNGIEIEFTEPLKELVGISASDYTIKQWWYKPTANYGGPNMDEKELEIEKIQVSPDRKKVMVELPGMKEEHVIYIRLNRDTMVSASGRKLWTTETWYTMNNIPKKN